MGEIVLAAKITHVPSMFISEQPGPHHGCRAAAIEGHREIARRARAAERSSHRRAEYRTALPSPAVPPGAHSTHIPEPPTKPGWPNRHPHRTLDVAA